MKKKAESRTLESMSQAIWYNRWTLGKFSKYLKGQILEIGCGIGSFTKFLIKYGQVTAIDINEDYILQAKKNVDTSIKIGFGDIEKGEYFFKNRQFDSIVCLNVLEHLRDDKRALKNIYRLMAPRGVLILLVPAHKFLYNSIDKSIGHFRRYDRKKLQQELKENGFEVSQIRNLNFLGGIGWYINGELFRENDISDTKIKIFNLIGPPFLLLENLFETPFGTSILVVAWKND